MGSEENAPERRQSGERIRSMIVSVTSRSAAAAQPVNSTSCLDLVTERLLKLASGAAAVILLLVSTLIT
jgi:hypothetical protein